MPDIRTYSPVNPDFARVLTIASLRGLAEFDFDLTPDPAESAALARLMGAQALRKLRFAGRFSEAADGAWRLDATLGATVIQTCVVSLDPVTTRVDIPVRRMFVPGAAIDGPEIVFVDNDEDDEIEPLGTSIDLGLVATEALALALPAYPRRSDARLEIVAIAPTGAEPAPETEIKPFAGLAALRAKMSDGQ